MTSFLNAYRNFIDVSTREGLTLLSNATDKFDCPLKDDDRISLRSGGHDYQKLKDALLCCSQKFGYQHFLNNVPTSKRILDVGPGVGTYSDLLCPFDYRMDAVEIFEPYVTKYKLREKYDNVYINSIVTKSFDIILHIAL